MNLTKKEKKLLKKLEKNWKHRYLAFIGFGIIGMKCIYGIIIETINEDYCAILCEYPLLIMALIVSFIYYFILRLHKIVEKLNTQKIPFEQSFKNNE